MHDVVISGGLLVSEGGASLGDVAVRGERIAEIAPRIASPARRRIDATGLLVLPGLIDPHVHLGLPMKGTRSSDDPDTGTAAALFGGVTTVIDFTLQRPGQSLDGSLRERLAEFEGKANCDYSLHVNVTDFPEGFDVGLGESLARLAGLGAASVKVFTAYSKEGMSIGAGALRAVLKQARAKGFRVLVHAEDDRSVNEAQDRLGAAGRVGATDYPLSRPAEAEARAIEEVCEAAREEGTAVYFVHVSTAGGLAAIRRARSRTTVPIYMETCPQYLTLDDSRYGRPDGVQYLVAPPLRKPEDRFALLGALGRGEIDVVATDHCLFRKSQKDLPGTPFLEIPNGLPGVETRLPILYTTATATGRIGVEEIVRLTSTMPARIFGLYPRKGSVAVGSDADLVLFDPDAVWTITPQALHMATDFSPYDGFQVRGCVRTVLLRGAVAIEGGGIQIRGSGRYLPRTPR
jgi:dihydropyrimidinase